MKKDSFVKGTIIAYIAVIIVKLLGAIYVIPFYSIIGEKGGVLYSYAYNIYNLFLNISTSGIPVAISIIISEYNSLKKFREKEQIFKIANKLICFLSLFFFLILFIFAPTFASFFVKDIVGGSSVEDVALVFRTISFCLLIIPFLSVIKGYLQGHKFVSITSISQVIEQTVRIFIILVGSYVAINILHTSVSVGVVVALSGAFIGGIIAYLYLKIKINKNKELFLPTEEDKSTNEKITTKKVVHMVLLYSLPIIFVSVTNDLYNIVDMKLILEALTMIGYDGELTESIASIICTWTPKICMIISAAAIGMGTSIIPHIMSSYVNKDIDGLNKKFVDAINMVLFLTLPLGIGLIMFSKPIYYIFYGMSDYGSSILKVVTLINIISCVYLILCTALQSMKKYKLVCYSTVIGLTLNLILDVPMVLLLNKLNFYPYLGTTIATVISYSLSNTIIFCSLKKEYKFSYKKIFEFLKKMIVPLILMTLTALITSKLLTIKIGEFRYLTVLIILLIYALLSGGVFVFATYKNKAIEMVFGSETVEKLLIKLHLKRRKNNEKN